MERVAGTDKSKQPPPITSSNKWAAISNLKLGLAMEESRRSGRTIMRGDTRKIVSDVQKLSRTTSTAHKKRTHQRKSVASNRLQQRLNMRSAVNVGTTNMGGGTRIQNQAREEDKEPERLIMQEKTAAALQLPKQPTRSIPTPPPPA